MKAVILAGGFGTRISEESYLKPKPMIEIGGKPILWHIMKLYSNYNINDFVICCGYKGYIIKEYFANYFLHTSDVTIDIEKNSMEVHKKYSDPWKITLVDTGDSSNTGGRLKRIESYIDDTFCMTYGDGLSNVNISDLIQFHRSQNTIATLTAIQPPGRFGSLEIQDNKITEFLEKPKGDNRWISGGFMVFEPDVFRYIHNDLIKLEEYPLETLAKENQLSVYKFDGFWHAMDTLRDKNYLQSLWDNNEALWKMW